MVAKWIKVRDLERSWEEEQNVGRKMMNLFFDTVVFSLAMHMPMKRPPGRQLALWNWTLSSDYMTGRWELLITHQRFDCSSHTNKIFQEGTQWEKLRFKRNCCDWHSPWGWWIVERRDSVGGAGVESAQRILGNGYLVTCLEIFCYVTLLSNTCAWRQNVNPKYYSRSSIGLYQVKEQLGIPLWSFHK